MKIFWENYSYFWVQKSWRIVHFEDGTINFTEDEISRVDFHSNKKSVFLKLF
jgi:hypothetical protein